MSMRIGQGYDVHRFGPGAALVIGGVRIPFDHAFVAHSDGDVLIHALCDALLGAAALGDIGQHFPDTDPQYAGADSRLLLREVGVLLRKQGWSVQNIDATLIAQAPRMAPYIADMRANLASDLNLPESAVSVKATTTERLGFEGRGEGIACQCSVLLSGA
jgi:2-C-methyl-D-erythritol 2,4-cyclodiphosphate synthase